VDDVHPVAHGELLRILRIELDARLRVVVDQFERPPEQAARGVDLVHRQHDGVDHRLAGRCEGAREVVEAADLDRRLLPMDGVAQQGGRGDGPGEAEAGRGEETAAGL
jgi:hypothetical protein